MDEDREKGRIVSLAVRRRKMTEHARAMVPALAWARAEITGGLKQPVSLRAYADWLNAHNHKTARGKVWRAQTIARLFEIDDTIREQANAERKRKLGVIKFKHSLLTHSDRRAQHAEHERAIQMVEDEYIKTVTEGVTLKSALVG